MEYIVQPAAKSVAELKATIYEHVNYSGTSQELGPGRYNINQLSIENNTLSSLKVPDGLMVTLYEDANFKGENKIFTEDTTSVGDFNDKTSCIVVQLAAELYQFPHYTGKKQVLPVGRYVTPDPNQIKEFNKYGWWPPGYLKISPKSLKLPSGLILMLYAKNACKGQTTTFTMSTENANFYYDAARYGPAIEVLPFETSIPSTVLMYGDTIALRSFQELDFVSSHPHGYLTTNSLLKVLNDPEKFTLVRSGKTRHNVFVSFGDTVSLRDHNDKYVIPAFDGSRLVTASKDDPNPNIDNLKKWTIIRSGTTLHKGFVCSEDIITLKSSDGKYMALDMKNRIIKPDNLLFKDTQDPWNLRSKWSILNYSPRHVIWAVDKDDNIYRRDVDTWTQIDEKLKQISVGGKILVKDVNSNDDKYRWIDHVWGVNSNDDIYRWNGSGWDIKSGKLKQISVGADEAVWGVRGDGSIYRWNGSGWDIKSGNLKQISVGGKKGEKDLVWGVNSNGNIFRWNGSGWDQIPRGGIQGIPKCLSVGADGAIFVLAYPYDTYDHTVYRRDGDTWKPMEINCDQISVLGKGLFWSMSDPTMYLPDLKDRIKYLNNGWQIKYEGNNNILTKPGNGKIYMWNGRSITEIDDDFKWKWVSVGIAPFSVGIAPFFDTTKLPSEPTEHIVGPQKINDFDGTSVCAAAYCNAAACWADACAAAACDMAVGAGVACAAFVGYIAACSGAICVLDANGIGGCVGDACGAAACAADGCAMAACGAAVCGADGCAAAACAADACGAAACGNDVCAAAACAADACPVEFSFLEACPIDACGANVCGFNFCPLDACGADACGLDVIPIIPGI